MSDGLNQLPRVLTRLQFKGSLVLALVCAAMTAGPAHAEEAPPARPTWTVQVDPLTTVLGFVHVQVERTFGDHASLYLGPSLRLFSNPFSDPEDFVGYGAEAGVRWYMFGTAPDGWWALVRGVGAYLQTDANGARQTAFGWYASALGGHTFILADWFVLSLGLGVQYLHYTVGGLGFDTVAPAAHTTFGVAF